MSLKKTAFLSVAVMLVSSLAWAVPDGPCARCKESPDDHLVPTAPALQTALRELWPESNLRVVEGSENSINIVGEASSAENVKHVMNFASIFHLNVINGITVGVQPQIQLQLLIAEVDCGKLELKGFDFKRACEFGSSSSIPVSSPKLAKTTNPHEVRAWLRELKQEDSAKIVAQPTLVTLNGRTASMIVGGECPVVLPTDSGKFIVETREYGIRVEFKPIILSDGRIRLEMNFEHSSLDYANGVEVEGQTVPGVTSRRLTTSAEVAPNEALVVCGLHCPLKCIANCKPQQPRELILMVNHQLVKPFVGASEPAQASTPPAVFVKPVTTEPHSSLAAHAPAKTDGEIKVVHGRSRVMHSRDEVVRSHVADPDVVDLVQFSAKEITIVGLNRGATTVTLWRHGKQAPLCLFVKVIKDPESSEDDNADLGKLEERINEMLPNSHIKLVPVAQKIVMLGEASDANEASQILAIVRHHETLCANEPSRFCQGAGGCMVFPQPVPTMCSSVVNMLTIRPTVQVAATEIESDAEQPHAPAILLTPSGGDPNRDEPTIEPRIRLAQVRVHESPTNKTLFGRGVRANVGLVGEIVDADTIKQMKMCLQSGCEQKSHCQNCHGKCCDQVVELQRIDSDDCDEEEDDDVESFIEQVLHAQMQHLESMMRARLAHERELLEAKAAADSALAKLKAEHADEILRLRLDHVAEMQNLKETVWGMERRSLELQHQQALAHERHIAELRVQHADEFQAQRIVALRSEIRQLQEKNDANCPECKPVTDLASTREHAPRHVADPEELPVLVEDLASGRVRYSPVPPKPTVHVGAQPVHDSVERVEFSTPPLMTSHSSRAEMERLRREVARLRSLVEDVLCIAPDSPPAPKPHVPDDEDED